MILVTMHHIVSDGWSIGMVDTVSALYEACRQGARRRCPTRPCSTRTMPLGSMAGCGARSCGGAGSLVGSAGEGTSARTRPRTDLGRRSPEDAGDDAPSGWQAALSMGFGPRPRRGRDAVHGPALGLRGPPPPLHRPGGLRRRHAGREPQPLGRGRVDRLLREHALGFTSATPYYLGRVRARTRTGSSRGW